MQQLSSYDSEIVTSQYQVAEHETQVSALVGLGQWLRSRGYRFITVTPETHRRVLARSPRSASTLPDIFGWNRPFDPQLLPAAVQAMLGEAGALRESVDGYRSAFRFSTLGSLLLVHSAYPTIQTDSVFFGPDTYRFCRMVAAARIKAHRCVDVGCGSGAGGLSAFPSAERVILADINPTALLLAGVNARLADREVELVLSDVLRAIEGEVDLVLANPPYMLDVQHRAYRDGGGSYGSGLAVRIAVEAIERLTPGGTLLLYTGAAVVEGEDVFFRAIQPLVAKLDYEYEEIDPDVFGEELEGPGYAEVDRIAAVMLRVKTPSRTAGR